MVKSNLFKRLLFVVLALVIFIVGINASNFTVVKAESNEIVVFSWEDYIDEELLTEFEQETGISVSYHTFATNEEMYNELKKAPNNCDLICPSEYMIMKMVAEGLIKKYEMPTSYAQYGSTYIKQVFEGIKCGENNEERLSEYAIGYMWGTMGFLYNMDNVNGEDINNFSSLWKDEYKGKSTIKDSVRDTYIMVLAKVYEQELLALDVNAPDYNQKLSEIFNRTDDASIEKVGMALSELKQNIYGFEVDSGKSDILTGRIDINFAWSGDAVYSMDEGDSAGVSLGYVVPEEGSNVWFDGWVMPTNADEENAGKFLDFISRPENAVRNMEYIGYTACIGGEEVFNNAIDWYSAESGVISVDEYNELEDEEKLDYGLYNGEYYCAIDYDENDNNIYGELVETGGEVVLQTYTLEEGVRTDGEVWEVYATDLKYFFDPTDTTGKYTVYSLETGRQLYAQYADEETINRCAVMNNFDNQTLEKINAMWNREKLITLDTWAIVLIVMIVVLGIVALLLYKYKDKVFKTKVPKAEAKVKKGNLKIIKKEML